MRKKIFSFFLFCLFLESSLSFDDDTFYYKAFCNNSIARLFARKSYYEASECYCEKLQYKDTFIDIDLDKSNLVRDQYMVDRLLAYGERHKEELLRCIKKIDIDNVSSDLYAEILIKEGLSYISAGLFEKAISVFERVKSAVKEEETLFYADLYISFCYFYLGRYADSSSILLENYRKYDNLNNMFLYLLAFSLYYNNETDKLLVLYDDDRMKALLDNVVEARSFMYAICGDVFLSRKEYSQALEKYEEALRSTRTNVQQQYDLLKLKIAFSKYKTGRVADSLDIFLDLSSLNDIIGSISCFYVGHIYLQQREYDKSLEFFTRVYKLALLDENNMAEALFYCAVCNVFLGRNDKALFLLDTFLEKYKNHPLFDTVGRLIVEINVPDYDYTKIIHSFEKGKNEDPHLRLIAQREYFYKAVECYEKGEHEECIAYCLKSMEYKQDNSVSILNALLCGEACYSLKRYSEAIKYFEEFLSDPVSKYKQHVMFLLGFCFYALGNYERALDVFLQIDLQDIPVDVGVRIANCLFNLCRYKEATEWYSKYEDINTFYMFRQALSLFLSDDKESARHVFGWIIQNKPSSRFFNEAVSYYYECLPDHSLKALFADRILSREMIAGELSKDLNRQESHTVSNIGVLDFVYNFFDCEDDATERNM